jgi:hypothetical protein
MEIDQSIASASSVERVGSLIGEAEGGGGICADVAERDRLNFRSLDPGILKRKLGVLNCVNREEAGVFPAISDGLS